MEYLIYIIISIGLSILWQCVINYRLNDLENRYENTKLILSVKEQWELSKHEVERVKRLTDKSYNFLEKADLLDLDFRIKRLEEKEKQ